MTFNSMDELKNYILSRSEVAIKNTQEQIYQIIQKFVKQYYSEFSPSVYERTYQLFRSLVKTGIKRTPNGWIAEVYFDVESLDYYMKKVDGLEVPNKGGWTAEEVLTSAAHGSHGGYTAGTAIWDEPLKVLNQETFRIFKNMLIDAGIPIR